MNKELTTEEWEELKENIKKFKKHRENVIIFNHYYEKYIFDYFYYNKFQDLTNEQLVSAASSYAENMMFKNDFLENN